MFLLPMRALLRQTTLGSFRINLRPASYLGNTLDVHENSREPNRQNVADSRCPDPGLDKTAKVYQRRATSGDTFGDLSTIPEVPADFVEGDEADQAEGTTFSREEQKERRRVHYSQLITELLAEKKLSMALEVLEKEMKIAKAKPDRKMFADLITFCGKVGYPQKAFSLFNQMKKRGYRMSGGIYTSLFNACANCPIPHIGLKYAERLHKGMNLLGWKPNVITYNAMIKAFGRSGDLETAFSIADQMMRDRVPLELKTMSFLLQACISNKEAGFLRAVQVWHKTRQFNFKPEIMSYNLLLRSVRDCGMGDIESVKMVFKTLMPDEEPLRIAANEENRLEAEVPGHRNESKGANPWELADPSYVHGTYEPTKSDGSKEVTFNHSPTRPDLLSLKPTLGGLVIVDEIKSASNRLMLLGGSKGVIDSMLADDVQPDIKTFTLLLDCIPKTITAEEALIKEMETSQVDPDTGFFNALIHRRGQRKDFISGFDVLDLMKHYQVGIDNITVHSLASCVTDIPNFHKFLDDIKEAGFSTTTPMLGSIMKNALLQTHFKFINAVMDVYQKYELPVHKGTMDFFDEFFDRNLRIFKGKDKPPARNAEFYSGNYFKVGMQLLIVKRADWKRRVKLDPTSVADYHDQFKKTGKEAEDLQPYIQKWKKGSRYTEWRVRKPQNTE